MEVELIKIVTYVILYSFLGWAMESSYISILQKRLVNSGFLYGPFCPIYGFGAVVLYIILTPFKGNLIYVFFVGFFVLSIWEYFVGFILEKLFKTKYWDYSNNKFNINGRVCLLNSIYWGVLSIIFIEIWNPIIEEQIAKIPQYFLVYLDIIIGAYIIIDMIVSSIRTANLSNRVQKLTRIGENIKEKVKQLEEMKKTSPINQRESLQKLVDELKLKQVKMRRKVERQIIRLRRAFPSIQSETIKEFLKAKKQEIKNKPKE